VRDTGVGLHAADAMVQADDSGFGLAQVRERLATAHGARGTLRMWALPEGGTCASVQLPIAATPPDAKADQASGALPVHADPLHTDPLHDEPVHRQAAHAPHP
jgi:signal transduction histidine kinase